MMYIMQIRDLRKMWDILDLMDNVVGPLRTDILSRVRMHSIEDLEDEATDNNDISLLALIEVCAFTALIYVLLLP